MSEESRDDLLNEETAALAKSQEDTAHMDPAAPDVGPTVEEAEQALHQAAAGSMAGSKAGTSVDSLVGRLVVEQGLATSDEVKLAMTLARSEEPEAAKSLTQILVDKEYVTKRQLARLREVIEAERSGQKIPGYKILGKLGSGAMATVYKAKQISLDRTVALKKLPEKFSSNPQFIERFFAEGRSAAQLNHPNIVQAFDVGNEGDIYYFVMEYVEGWTVHDDIVKHKRFTEAEAVETIMQVAEALEHAHARGLIHRDVKPKNIMIAKEGIVKLADMGLARGMSDVEAAEAEKGKAFGTPYYISPEQIRGEMEIGPPADIYSLGATFYHMVTGSVPFEAKSPSEVMRKHLKAELVPPDHVNSKLSAGVSEVIEMMMAKKAADRYQNCTDLLLDLRAVKGGEQPPIAHKDTPDLSNLAQVEAQADGGIPEDRSVEQTRPISEILLSGPFLVLVLLFVVSVALNLVLALGG
ncbi:MAG: serine/threonine protein kinase [Phycisphaerales bacterium]|jgi:serine/threonine protein kinase